MTNQEILTKAIQKAIDGGWPSGNATYELCDFSDMPMYRGDGQILAYFNITLKGRDTTPPTRREFSVFNHDFAKALWGENTYTEAVCPECGYDGLWEPVESEPLWQYHLQQMVIADDPIKYLGENI